MKLQAISALFFGLLCLCGQVQAVPVNLVQRVGAVESVAADQEYGPVSADAIRVGDYVEFHRYIDFKKKDPFGIKYDALFGWVTAITDGGPHGREFTLSPPGRVATHSFSISAGAEDEIRLTRHLRLPFGRPSAAHQIKAIEFFDFTRQRWVFLGIGSSISIQPAFMGNLAVGGIGQVQPSGNRPQENFDFPIELTNSKGKASTMFLAQIEKAYLESGALIHVPSAPDLLIEGTVIQSTAISDLPVIQVVRQDAAGTQSKFSYLSRLRAGDIFEIVRDGNGKQAVGRENIAKVAVAYRPPATLVGQAPFNEYTADLTLLSPDDDVAIYQFTDETHWRILDRNHPSGFELRVNHAVMFNGALHEIVALQRPASDFIGSFEPSGGFKVVLAKLPLLSTALETQVAVQEEEITVPLSQIRSAVTLDFSSQESVDFLGRLNLVRARKIWAEANKIRALRREYSRSDLARDLCDFIGHGFLLSKTIALDWLPSDLKITSSQDEVGYFRQLVQIARYRFMAETQFHLYWKNLYAAKDEFIRQYGHRPAQGTFHIPNIPLPEDPNVAQWNAYEAFRKARVTGEEAARAVRVRLAEMEWKAADAERFGRLWADYANGSGLFCETAFVD